MIYLENYSMVLELLLAAQNDAAGSAAVGLFSGFYLVIMAFYCFIGLFSLFALIGWVLALVDCVKRQFKAENDKIVWILIIVLAGIIGAAIYYFMVYRKEGKAQEKKPEVKTQEKKDEIKETK